MVSTSGALSLAAGSFTSKAAFACHSKPWLVVDQENAEYSSLLVNASNSDPCVLLQGH